MKFLILKCFFGTDLFFCKFVDEVNRNIRTEKNEQLNECELMLDVAVDWKVMSDILSDINGLDNIFRVDCLLLLLFPFAMKYIFVEEILCLEKDGRFY